MDKVKLPRSAKVYLPLVALFFILLFLMPRSSKFNYDYRKGSAWYYETLVAQFDFPILKTEEELRQERLDVSAEDISYYKNMPTVPQEVVRAFDQQADFGAYDALKKVASSEILDIYDKGLIAVSEKFAENTMIFIRKADKARKYPLSEL